MTRPSYTKQNIRFWFSFTRGSPAGLFSSTPLLLDVKQLGSAGSDDNLGVSLALL